MFSKNIQKPYCSLNLLPANFKPKKMFLRKYTNVMIIPTFHVQIRYLGAYLFYIITINYIQRSIF